MTPPAVRPTGRERRFDDEEIIVSKTDRKGVMTYVNDVFVRVSAYSADELMGKPHNLIRHPDMPGGVFRLLWENLAAGREMFAFINNLAKDGCHYWVLAHVTPSRDHQGNPCGYHSNRRTPDPAAVREVSRIYAQMRSMESGLPGPAAAKVSQEWLGRVLSDNGQSYDEFVWQLIGQSAHPTESRVATPVMAGA